ncbi:MAG TPA: FadR/GntR family transcriptional regulator [Roseomonas sp.]|jgi:DNA-binding FadR family transcriptional regulator
MPVAEAAPVVAADERAALIGAILRLAAEARLQPGARLPAERELAERLGAGRNAVREAIAVLEALRLVERRPNSGIYLRAAERVGSLDALVLQADLGVPLTRAEVDELVELRRMMELQGTALACQRRTPADLTRLAAALAEGSGAIDQGEAYAAHDAAFHLAVAEATGNRIFLRVVNSFYLLSRERRRRYFADGSRAAGSQAQHAEMLDAIRDQDAPRAAEIMSRHLQGVESYWLELLRRPKRGERKDTEA